MKNETILNRYLAIKQKQADLKAEEDRLKKMIDKNLGEEESIDIGGYRFLRELRQIKKYNVGLLREIIGDEDAVSRCLIPDSKLVKATLKEFNIPKEQAGRLNDNMDILTESTAIKIKKINTKL